MKKFYIAFFALCLSTGFVGCNNDDDPVVVATDLQIAPGQLNFAFDATDPQYVTVVTDGTSWSAVPDAEWITVKPDEGIFAVSVTPNTEMKSRTSTVTVQADDLKKTLSVTQNFDRDGNWYMEFIPDNGASFTSISDNGKWVVGSVFGNGIIYNVETGESQYFSIEGEDGTTNQVDIYDVADDGMAVGSWYHSPAICKNGEWEKYDMQGYSSGAIYSVSPDGTLCAGYVMTGSDSKPVQWKNGTFSMLTCPETTFLGDDPYAGFVVKSMSADGICVGTDWTDQLGCYWDKQGNVIYYGKDMLIYEEEFLMSDYGTEPTISPDGRYITSTFYDYTVEVAEPPFSAPSPLVYDLKTGKATLLEYEGGGHGNVTSTDGVTFFGTAKLGVSELAVVYENGTYTPMGEWLRTNYGIKINHLGGEPMSVSADGKTVVGYYLLSGNYVNYIIHLGKRIQ